MSKTGKSNKTTLASIGRHTGLDVSTVSRVLNGDPQQRVNPETRDRILSSAKELNYLPNMLARGLRGQRTSSICIVLPQLDNPAFSDMVDGAVAVCAERDYFPYIVLTPPDYDTTMVLRKLQQLNHVDGVLAATFDENEIVARAVETLPMPTVLLNKKVDGPANCVWMDSETAAEAVTHHLLKAGHRKIGFIGGAPGGFNARQRLNGYLAALASYGVTRDDPLIREVGYDFYLGRDAAEEMLADVPDMTAIFAATFVTAAGAMNAVRGLPQPRQASVAVAGIHGGVLAECLGLTAVDMPTFQLGYQGASGLIDLILGNSNSIRRSLSPLDLVVRASTTSVSVQDK